jgi:NTP pyrophosphatase (non-canonical NTP hydrolase)
MRQDILEQILQFRKDRDWEQFHTPKNLAASISIEASELLELYQWGDSADDQAIKEEVADIFIYLLYFCHDQKIDLWDAVEKKIIKNNSKYSVQKSKGNAKKYTELEKS